MRSPVVLMRAFTGCNLDMLGWNKIERRNTLFQYFFHFQHTSGIHWKLTLTYVFWHLEVPIKHDFFALSWKNGFTPLLMTLNSSWSCMWELFRVKLQGYKLFTQHLHFMMVNPHECKSDSLYLPGLLFAIHTFWVLITRPKLIHFFWDSFKVTWLDF